MIGLKPPIAPYWPPMVVALEVETDVCHYGIHAALLGVSRNNTATQCILALASEQPRPRQAQCVSSQ